MEDPMSFSPKSPSHAGLSYKFQRLREKLRQAIASGELSGKLPGERSLAKRFHVNAKTLSKALTDLAAEGLLDRSIGRGTFVKGHAPTTVSLKRWLVVCDAAQADWELIQMLRFIPNWIWSRMSIRFAPVFSTSLARFST
jgi:DNA-binding GntR family transcriptional regulator